MSRVIYSFVLASALLTPLANAEAFCGFYVAKADATLFNKASKVVVARKDQRTVVTMASDYHGDPADFAIVIPVPTVVTKEQIHITENRLIDQLDAYSAPRLVEYHDPDPCREQVKDWQLRGTLMKVQTELKNAASPFTAAARGVTIEAEYTVGEYDIQILSAKESDGLQAFLDDNGYKMPKGAAPVLASYIKQGMKFFVAKVNLQERKALGFEYLRPIQVAYETEKFMLPVRLGTVNADGAQELFVFMLSERGRVETTNYKTRKIPSDANVPLFTKAEFGPFYKALFDKQVARDGGTAVYLEYAWSLGWCDPCVTTPPSDGQLRELGAFWLNASARNLFITRLHVRYDSQHFPEDLMFHETSNTETFQGRYVLRHPYTGEAKCDAAKTYRAELARRFRQEALSLSDLTGWDVASIERRMAHTGQATPDLSNEAVEPWYRRMWHSDGR